MKALITDIKRFAVHDGNGIRTTVFFKGCPLRCVWCHNPEGFTNKREFAFYAHKCTHCGACADICDLHKLNEGNHFINRKDCTFCGRCTEICPVDALKIFGMEMSAREIFDVVAEDKFFYDTSNGGVTLSGGECLIQADFCADLLKMCRDAGINTAVDTSGYIDKTALDKVIPYTDTFLYDLKAMDDDIHIKYTGVSNKLIIDNIKYLDSLGCRIEIRIPYIPEYNDGEIRKLSSFIQTLSSVVRVRILPYHNYAESKYIALGLKNTLPDVRLPTYDECAEIERKHFTVS